LIEKRESEIYQSKHKIVVSEEFLKSHNLSPLCQIRGYARWWIEKKMRDMMVVD